MRNRRPLRKTNEYFIKECNIVHSNYYDYSESLYNGSRYDFTFKCPVHGFKTMNARKHLSGQGCKKCGTEKQKISNAKTCSKKYALNFFKRCSEIHGDKFDYSKVSYVNGYTDITIGCPFHGYMEIEPRHHLKGTGCLGCGRANATQKKRNNITLESLLKDFITVHGETFDYSGVNLDDYRGVGKTKIDIICKEHGVFQQTIRSHLQGNGCNKCRYFGYTRSAYINNCIKRKHQFSEYYVVRFFNENESFIKLGITTQGIKTRYRKIKERGYYNMEILYSKHLDPSLAWDTERLYKSLMIDYKYQPLNDFPGSTECFSLDLPIDEIISNLTSL